MAAGKVLMTSAVSTEGLARQIFAHELATWVKYDPLAREGLDPEGVHQLRVTSRRLRAELGVLSPVLSRGGARDLAKELRWIGTILGRQRDLDVLFELLTHLEHEESPFDASVLARLRRQRDAERRRVRDALSSARYRHLARDLATWAVEPPLRRRARESASDALRPRLLNGLSALFDGVDGIGPNVTDETLHRLRITIKRSRYRAEVAAPVLGPNADAVAKDLAKAQGVLGDLHDRVVASAYLGDWRASRWPVDAAASDGDPVDVALVELGDEMAALRRAWRAPLARARRRSTTLYLDASVLESQH
ncbi:MAG TPA: CHAD domain-containing protein [Acidimicrobiales bacterium]|nr:CHAD domain-containing protein [Acidimicrobiales bacterium]